MTILSMFGESETPSEAEQVFINDIVETCPLAVFQTLNKQLNKQFLCLIVGAIDQGKEENIKKYGG